MGVVEKMKTMCYTFHDLTEYGLVIYPSQCTNISKEPQYLCRLLCSRFGMSAKDRRYR